jgi:hypothetical protein
MIATPLEERRSLAAMPSAAAASWGHVGLSALVFAAVGGLAAVEGGYFPPSWGWATLASSWVVILALAVRPRITMGSFDVALVGGLTAFAAWVAASIIWSRAVPQSVLEVQRALVYVAAVGACLLMIRRRSVPYVLGGVFTAVSVIAGYALFTRLFPDRFDNFDAIAGYRLTGPIGYWNALGIFAAIGVCLGIGFASRGSNLATRASSAAALVLLVPALYFTYSRGAWVALAAALVFTLALDPRRLQLLAGISALAPAPAIALAVAANSRGLTHTDTSLEVAADQGHRFALLLLPLCVLAAASAALLWRLEKRVEVTARVRSLVASGLAGAAVAASLVGILAAGGPVSLVERVVNEFESPPVSDPNLNVRLFSLSGSGRDAHYRVAWDAFRERPLIGSGAGSFEQHWLRDRPVAAKVRDAHSLYLETLSDLGLAGLMTLLIPLAVPLVAAVVARGQPLVPIAFGAYVAFLLHAGIDWDWEMPAVTVSALLCGVTLVASARRGHTRTLGTWARTVVGVAAIGVGSFAFIGLIGNTEIDRAGDAIRARDFAAGVAPARKSNDWAPWSADGWRRLGQAQLGLGQKELARRNLRIAVRKDPQNWDRWFDLALATHGPEQRRALSRALELNPRSPEVAEFIRGVGLAGFDLGGG